MPLLRLPGSRTVRLAVQAGGLPPGRYTFRLILAEGSVLSRRVVRTLDTSLFEAAAFGTADLVRALIRHGQKPDQVGAHSRTPLMLSAAFANTETATALLEAGASPFARDDAHRTALDYARTYAPDHQVVPALKALADGLTIE